jgi:hypothetical protein
VGEGKGLRITNEGGGWGGVVGRGLRDEVNGGEEGVEARRRAHIDTVPPDHDRHALDRLARRPGEQGVPLRSVPNLLFAPAFGKVDRVNPRRGRWRAVGGRLQSRGSVLASEAVGGGEDAAHLDEGRDRPFPGPAPVRGHAGGRASKSRHGNDSKENEGEGYQVYVVTQIGLHEAPPSFGGFFGCSQSLASPDDE